MTLTIRNGTKEDLFGCFVVFQLALHGLYENAGQASPEDKPNPEELAPAFDYFQMFTEHFTKTAEHFWVAEEAGEIIGFSRSMLRDGILQLSELFVHPEKQAQGVGKRLLEAVFSSKADHNRVVIGTSDIRAMIRYLKSGVKFRFTIYDWSRKPEVVPFETDLTIEPFTATPENVAVLNSIDKVILGYTREIDHIWLCKNRQGHFYRRNGQVVGYSYVSHRAGPIAMLHNPDFHTALAHVESEMTKYVNDFWENIYLPVPMTNTAAVEYMLKRGFQTSPLLEHFMSDQPLGQYENYIFMDPPFIT
jgi:GNAT superfamily N-acetyltransferase